MNSEEIAPKHIHEFVYNPNEDDHFCACGVRADDCMFEVSASQPSVREVAPTDEEYVRSSWSEVKIYEGGDGCHIEIIGVQHPHFYGNVPCNAWMKAANWTREIRKATR